nr:MAG: hypothetical protein DIU78_00125 [Pseudomonadota bacterium]
MSFSSTSARLVTTARTCTGTSHGVRCMDIELNSGSRLGNYRLLVRIGRGGMASVWVARDERARDRPLVAVKALLPELTLGAEFRAMFLEESQIIRSIDHPNVAKVHAVGEDRGILFMAMEWIEGDSLRALVRGSSPRALPPEIAARIVADAAFGLHAAHELRGWDGELRNVVHCDVSPHNVLVGMDGVAKVVDFGVANATFHADFGGAEKVKGKLGYMSPEQARGEPLDRRSDVFSLGIVLYEITTGARLFQGESPAHTIALVREARIPDPRSHDSRYPEKLRAILGRALQPQVDRRFATALEFGEALEQYLRDERIFVARRATASLVRRVLGSHIEEVRSKLHQALLAVDGAVNQNLIPDVPLQATSFSGVAPASAPEPSRDSSGALSKTPRPETYEIFPQPRSSAAPWVFACSGVVAAVASIVWAMAQPPRDAGPLASSERPVSAAHSSVPASETESPSEPGTATRDSAEGSEEHEIELVETNVRPRTTPGARPAAPATRASVAGNAPNKQQAKAIDVVLTEEPAPRRIAAEEVVLTDEPSPAVGSDLARAVAQAVAGTQPKGVATGTSRSDSASNVAASANPAGPFNRGVALAQLGSAAQRAAGCRRPGGAKGQGRANVTFAPDGHVTNVAIPPPFAGTPVGACVVEAFRGARVPAFTGTAVTLPWSFRVPE